jgi:adenosylcobinamide kinase / adenosylcobinamide-phosphate guanylyltransferase
MSRIILITGGARSGKSRFAEELALGFGNPLAYIATCEAKDLEMLERVERHRMRRGPAWSTIEEPYDLAGVIRRYDDLYRVMLVDCITLWLTNLLLKYDDVQKVMADVNDFASLFSSIKTPLILVTNEVGMGIVPENRLARTFRDIAGEANQLLACAADEVHVTISGLPLKLKG